MQVALIPVVVVEAVADHLVVVLVVHIMRHMVVLVVPEELLLNIKLEQ